MKSFGNTTSVDRFAWLSVAPMMDWTDRHCRYLHRLMSRRTLLYTEMVTAPALVRGDARHLLRFDPAEHPVALQLGGSDPLELAQAARMGEGEGYDEINLNVGCPSDRVQSGTFGAVLMKTPDLVAECCRAMREVVSIPVTVKCRIGVDDQNPAEVLPDFLVQVRDAGVSRVAIHARKAWLKGLSPKENREIPPLDYGLVQQMKSARPALFIGINGGLTTLADIGEQLAVMDGVMIGRAAYRSPMILAGLGEVAGAHAANPDLDHVIETFKRYAADQCAAGARLHHVVKPLLGLLAGQPGARLWRQRLSDIASHDQLDASIIQQSFDAWKAFVAERALEAV